MQKITRLRFGIGLTLALVMVLSVLLSFALMTFETSNSIVYAEEKYNKPETETKLYNEIYEYPNSTNDGYYIPAGWYKEIGDGFPMGSVPQFGSGSQYNIAQGMTTSDKRYIGNNANVKVIDPDAYANAPLPLTNFGTVGAREPDNPTKLKFSQNEILFTNDTAYTQFTYWQYMYGYISIPKALQGQNGKLIVSADVNSYEIKEIYTYFSLAAGDRLNETKTSGYLPSDIHMNKKTGHTYKQSGNNYTDKFPSTGIHHHMVEIDIRPHDRYARISLVALTGHKEPLSKDYSTVDHMGLQLSNVKVVGYRTMADNNITNTTTASGMNGKEIRINANDVTKNSNVANTTINQINITAPDNSQITATKDGTTNDFVFTAKQNGTYKMSIPYNYSFVRAHNASGNINANASYTLFREFEVSGIDLTQPAFSNVVGNDKKVAGSRKISFDVTDEAGIKSVEVTQGGKAVATTQSGNTYSFVADTNAVYNLKAVDKNDNVKEYVITVINIIKAAEGVDIEYTADDTVTVTKKLKAYNTMLGDPNTTKGTATKVYNFGIEAKYTITYDLSQGDVSETIDIPAPAKMLSVNVDGVQNSVAYGDSFKLKADTSKGEFVGWYNERGGMVSDSKEYTISKVVTNMTFTAKYVTRNEILNVTFVNPNGNIIDIKSFADATELDRILDTTSVYPGVKAPEGVHMTFKCWRVISGKGTANVTVKAIYTTAQQFNVTVDGVTTAYYYNQRVTLTDAQNGWGIVTANGIEKVTGESMYTFYVLSDIELVRIQSEPTKDAMTATHTTTKVNGKDVISLNGFVNVDKAYSEVGFVFSNASEYLTADNFILENVDTMRISVANTKGGQFIVNVDATAFAKAKFRVYAIDTSGNVTYGEIMTLGGIA